MSREDLLSSSAAARVLGVSTTSVKRWADDGLLVCARTAGRHRRFARDTVERFRETLTGVARAEASVGDPWLTTLLADGDAHALEAKLLESRAELGSWASVGDRVGAALRALGEAWARGHVTVLEEHVASERLERALTRICDRLPAPPGAPRALLSTAEDEDHTLGLHLVELALREVGWSTLFAGRATSSHMIVDWVTRSNKVELVCLSASRTSKDRARLAEQTEIVGRTCDKRGVRLVLGGEGAWPDRPRHGHRLHRVAELPPLLRRRR